MEKVLENTQQQEEVFLPLVPENHSKKKSRRRSEIIFICFMLLIPIIQFIIFWVVPNFDSILLGFKNPDGEWTLLNFQNFFEEIADQENASTVKYAIVNSLIYFAVNIFICTPLVIFFSYVLFRKVPMHGLFKVLFYLPSIIGGLVTASLFKEVFSNGGPMFELLNKMGLLSDEALQWGLFSNVGDTAFLMVLIYSIWTCVGINMIMFYGAMRRIPQDIFESAEIDGIGFFRQFFKIVVPLIWPTISTLIIFSLSGIFVTYGAVMVLAPNVRSASMIGWYITDLIKNDANLEKAAAIGLLFTAVGLPFVLLVRWLLNKVNANVEY